MDPIVHVERLRKVYGSTTAVEAVSFKVHEGEIFGMVGPNGAGKTTTIECLEGLRRPDGGTVRVLGLDPQQDGKTLRLRTGMQLQQSNLPDRMRVWEALDLYASFYPKAVDWRELLAQLGLEEKRNAPFSKLSGGQKQRLFVALALLPDPELVFLDELTTGLDPQARHAIWDLVRGVRSRGKTVVLTTHFMEEAERLCDRVAILDHGRVVAMDTPAAPIRCLGVEECVIFSLDGGRLPASFEEAMLIFSGAAWPRELMPEAVARLSAFLPLTYVVNLLRGLWAGETWGAHLLDVGVLVAMLLVGIIVSAKTFHWE